jgi:predicted outer membrane protein
MEHRELRLVLPVMISAFLVVAGARAAAAADAPDAAVAPVLNKLHHSNQKEVHMGQEAKAKGQSEAVKEYGATLERDHTAADEKVAALARKRNIELSDPPPGHASHELAPGEGFDKQFAKMMVDDHKKDIASVKAEHDKTTDPELKELLAHLLPTLEKHLATAEALADGKEPPKPVQAAP